MSTQDQSKTSEVLVPEVLFEDTHLIVLNKPAGLLSQGEHKGDPNVVDWLRERWGRPYVGLIHRLDRNTSGLMVVAKRTKSARRLTHALQTGKMVRTYVGWVHGVPVGDGHDRAMVWRHFLSKDRERNVVRVVRTGTEEAQEAVLRARVIQTIERANEKLSLLEFELETGRSHQIRAQAAHEGFPLVGDVKYGRKSGPNHAKRPLDAKRPLLHSARLRFPHPMSGEELSFEAPLPVDMRM